MFPNSVETKQDKLSVFFSRPFFKRVRYANTVCLPTSILCGVKTTLKGTSRFSGRSYDEIVEGVSRIFTFETYSTILGNRQ